MASHGTVQRSSATSTSPTLPTTHPHEPKDTTTRVRLELSLCFPFNIPKTPEAAAERLIRNLSYYRLYYTLFIWIILFIITLVPQRKLSLILLIAMTALTCSLLAVMRLVPAGSVVLQYKIIDRRLVLALLVIATMVELIVTRAAIHLFVTLACAIPVILIHAVFRVRDDLCVEEEASAAGELVPLIRNSEPKLLDSV